MLFFFAVDLNMETSGLRASQTCIGWALAVVNDARRAGLLEKPEGVTLGDKLLMLENDVFSLFNYQFQVMPYNYVQLIGSVTTLYLTSYAFHKGCGFVPEATLLNGLAFPLANVCILVMACVGLMTVGTSLANPLGSDTVDFAVLTFVRSGAVNSKNIIDVQEEWIARGGAQPDPKKAKPPPSAGRPVGFQSKVLDSYDGALGGCSSALLRRASSVREEEEGGSSGGVGKSTSSSTGEAGAARGSKAKLPVGMPLGGSMGGSSSSLLKVAAAAPTTGDQAVAAETSQHL